MAPDKSTEQRAWVSLERGPTQNAAYVIGGTFVFVCLLGSFLRAWKGLPFDAAVFAFTAKLLLGVGAFTLLTTFYLKSWKVKYNEREVLEGYSLFVKTHTSRYAVSNLRSISCYFSRSLTVFGLPFDTLVFHFGGNRLMLRTSDWKRESLKQFIRDLMSYRPDVSADPLLLNYIAGDYNDIFVDASERPHSSSGYEDRASF